MMYAYIGEAKRDYAEVIISRHHNVVVSGVYNDGTVELAVKVDNGNPYGNRIVDMFSRALERERL